MAEQGTEISGADIYRLGYFYQRELRAGKMQGDILFSLGDHISVFIGLNPVAEGQGVQ